jgi:GNAT superfamily N-acetyltransferase
MAALTQPARVSVRAALPGEGRAIALLWRELWEEHENWGGYPGSRDPRVYEQLAARLDDDARVRGGHPTLGRHVHVVADLAGAPCGQVEGWFERHGVDESTPFTCEVRSLIVGKRARGLGAGRALLDALARAARALSRGAPCVLAAEVLERNPAQTFYTRVGFSAVSYSARIHAASGVDCRAGSMTARLAAPADASAVAHLEGALAARRWGLGDARFDRPRVVDAPTVGAIAAHLVSPSSASLSEPATVLAVDAAGIVRGAASVTAHTLEPPFVPLRRALVGRFSVDGAFPTAHVVGALVAYACRLALSRGAMHVELTDLSPPGTDLHDAALAAGATGWSRVVTRYA